MAQDLEIRRARPDELPAHDDNRADIKPKPIELWTVGDAHRTGDHDRIDGSYWERDLQEWNNESG